MWDAARITRLLESCRLPLGAEKKTQAEIEKLFEVAGLPFEREAKLDNGDIVDFLACGYIAIEVKLKAQRMALLRQCERQALDPRVREHILVTNVATGWPASLEGKPAYFVDLSKAWMG